MFVYCTELKSVQLYLSLSPRLSTLVEHLCYVQGGVWANILLAKAIEEGRATS
jgi:hypothetical protein